MASNTETGLQIPFIVVSGHLKTEDAVLMMRAGAEDFVQKDDIARLVPAVERALRDAELERARAAATEEAERYGRVLDEAAAEIYWVDAQRLAVVHLNQGASRNSGYDADTLCDQPFALPVIERVQNFSRLPVRQPVIGCHDIASGGGPGNESHASIGLRRGKTHQTLPFKGTKQSADIAGVESQPVAKWWCQTSAIRSCSGAGECTIRNNQRCRASSMLVIGAN